jgi:hypothetical protein
LLDPIGLAIIAKLRYHSFNMAHKRKRFRKNILLSFITIIFILISTHLLVNSYQNELAQYAIGEMEQKSKGIYSIKVDDVDLDFLMRRITINNLTLTPSTSVSKSNKKRSQPKTLVGSHIKHLKITGISYWHLILNKSLRADTVTIKNGNLSLFKRKKESPGSRKSLHIKSLDAELIHPKISLKKSKRKELISFKTGRAFCKDLTLFSKDGFYQLKAESIVFNKPDDALFLSGLRLIPSYNKYLFSKKKGYQINRFALEIDSITIDGLDTDALLNRRRLSGQRMFIRTADLEIFRNLRIKKRKRLEKDIYPLHMLRKIKFNVTLDEILFHKVSFKYSAHLAKVRKPGTIMVTDIFGRIVNFSNNKENLNRKKRLKLSATGKIMGKGPLSATMTIPLTKKPQAFSVSGSLGKMKLGKLNSILFNNHIKINKGQLDNMTFSLQGNPNKISGEMRLKYRDLNVSLLKKEDRKKRRRFVSFLANWVLHSQNPKLSKPLRIGNIHYKKENPMSFFSFLWKAMLEGIKSSIGLKKAK